MGTDVYGRHPNAPAGEYFQATVWSWRPLHALTVKLCSDLLGATTLRAMAFRRGAGPEGPEACVEMASRFERWLERHAARTDGGLQVSPEGLLVGRGEAAANAGREAATPYVVTEAQLKRWVEFLRHCGGFAVY
jgi:hypothetical protein